MKSPCLGCRLENESKDNPECEGCDRRITYLATLGGAYPGDQAPESMRKGTCMVEGCDNPVRYTTEGLCTACYMRKRDCRDKGRPFESKLSGHALAVRKGHREKRKTEGREKPGTKHSSNLMVPPKRDRNRLPEMEVTRGMTAHLFRNRALSLVYGKMTLKVMPGEDHVRIDTEGWVVRFGKKGVTVAVERA